MNPVPIETKNGLRASKMNPRVPKLGLTVLTIMKVSMNKVNLVKFLLKVAHLPKLSTNILVTGTIFSSIPLLFFRFRIITLVGFE